jgi:hypothetical protein
MEQMDVGIRKFLEIQNSCELGVCIPGEVDIFVDCVLPYKPISLIFKIEGTI